jgi:hypothetical protein
VASLRYPVSLGFDEIVVRAQPEDLIAFDERSDLVRDAPCGCRKILADPREHGQAAVMGRQQPLDVLHHEDGRRVRLDDSQVLAVQEVLFVRLESLVVGASCPSGQRVGLARRPAYENPARGSSEGTPDSRIDKRGTALAQFRVHDFGTRLAQRLFDLWQGVEGFSTDLATQQPEVGIKLTDRRKMAPDRSQSQRAARNLVLFNGQGDPEGALPALVGERGEAFAQAPGTREDIDDRNTS